jgi:hypothetical protein
MYKRRKGKCIQKLQHEIAGIFQGTPAPNSSSRPFRRLRARTHVAAPAVTPPCDHPAASTRILHVLRGRLWWPWRDLETTPHAPLRISPIHGALEKLRNYPGADTHETVRASLNSQRHLSILANLGACRHHLLWQYVARVFPICWGQTRPVGASTRSGRPRWLFR